MKTSFAGSYAGLVVAAGVAAAALWFAPMPAAGQAPGGKGGGKGGAKGYTAPRAGDGKADIQVQLASAVHDAEWKQSRDQAIGDGEIDLNAGHDPDDWEVYFLEVRGTTKGRLGGGARK